MLKIINNFEEVAISGALTCLKATRPICAISLYQKKTDTLQVPMLCIKNLDNYSYFLRSYTETFIDTIFYAVPKEKFSNEL